MDSKTGHHSPSRATGTSVSVHGTAALLLVVLSAAGCATSPTSSSSPFSTIEITSDTRVFMAGNVTSFDEAKRHIDVTRLSALSSTQAKGQFTTTLSNAASINTAEPAVTMQGGKDELIRFNAKLLPAILKDTGIQPGNDVYNIIARQNETNVREGTFSKFTFEGTAVRLIRYRSLGAGTGMYDEIEKPLFDLSGEPELIGDSLWHFDRMNLEPKVP